MIYFNPVMTPQEGAAQAAIVNTGSSLSQFVYNLGGFATTQPTAPASAPPGPAPAPTMGKPSFWLWLALGVLILGFLLWAR